MKAQTEIITVEQALRWLKSAPATQRNISKAWAHTISERIAEGCWDSNAGPFIVVDGILHDGFHRASAIVKAGKPVRGVVLEYETASKWIDDTRRRSVSDRNFVGKDIAAASRIAGRIVGVSDPDKALRQFGPLAKSAGVSQVLHSRPWSCSAVHVGLMAAHGACGVSSADLNRIANGNATNKAEMHLLKKAAAGSLDTTGTGQITTAILVMSALIGKKIDIVDLQKALAA